MTLGVTFCELQSKNASPDNFYSPFIYNHRVSSNSNLPDLETNNNVNHGNDPKPNKTHFVIKGMPFQQSQQQQEKQQQKQPQETHIPISKQLLNEVIVKKKEVCVFVYFLIPIMLSE